MVIRLVRTDAVDPSKIQLPPGEYIIGRGKLLDCDDKRISRQHGRLDVSNDTITIKALHQNPCFFTKMGSTEVELLRQDNSATLSTGDKFGLLPDIFWYEVLLCNSHENCDSEKNTEEYCMEQNILDDETTSVEANYDKRNSNPSSCNENVDGLNIPNSPSLIVSESIEQSHVLTSISEQSVLTATNRQTQSNDSTDVETVIKPSIKDEPKEEVNELNEVNTQNKMHELNVSNITDKANETIVKNKSIDNPKVNEQPNAQVSQIQSNDVDQLNSAVKRRHSSDDSDVKKVKTESVDTNEAVDQGAGPCLKQEQKTVNDGASTANAATNNTNNPPRERCMYGANCYRKNPQHSVQFSHPRDPDWGPGDRGVCPYGASCLKRDPRHWRDHEHPPGTAPRPRQGQRKRHQKRDSVAVSPQNVIVQGKRVRKVVHRENWSSEESEGEPDPYGTDESEEWEPDSLERSQDYSEDYI